MTHRGKPCAGRQVGPTRRPARGRHLAEPSLVPGSGGAAASGGGGGQLHPHLAAAHGSSGDSARSGRRGTHAAGGTCTARHALQVLHRVDVPAAGQPGAWCAGGALCEAHAARRGEGGSWQAQLQAAGDSGWLCRHQRALTPLFFHHPSSRQELPSGQRAVLRGVQGAAAAGVSHTGASGTSAWSWQAVPRDRRLAAVGQGAKVSGASRARTAVLLASRLGAAWGCGWGPGVCASAAPAWMAQGKAATPTHVRAASRGSYSRQPARLPQPHLGDQVETGGVGGGRGRHDSEV